MAKSKNNNLSIAGACDFRRAPADSVSYLTIETLNTHYPKNEKLRKLLKVNTHEASFTVENYVKEYPQKYRIFKYRQSYEKLNDGLEPTQKTNIKSRTEDNQTQESKAMSLSRTRTKIADLILCNEFELFGTLTTDPKVVERFNDNQVKRKMTKALNNIQRKYPFQYLLIPERHQNGALHFHALFSGLPQHSLIDSGHADSKKRPIYNWIDYKLGFSNLSEIANIGATANYCRKYITKNMTLDFNKRRYWASKDLKRPQTHHNANIALLESQNTPKERVHQTVLYDIFEITKLHDPIKELLH